MAVNDDYLRYVLEQLSGLADVTSRRMFGGVGLYGGGLFFALIAGGTLYFKVDDSNRADYSARGMNRFRPYGGAGPASMAYYEVPADVLEDAEECAIWARRSVATAHASRKRGRPRQGRKRTTSAA